MITGLLILAPLGYYFGYTGAFYWLLIYWTIPLWLENKVNEMQIDALENKLGGKT